MFTWEINNYLSLNEKILYILQGRWQLFSSTKKNVLWTKIFFLSKKSFVDFKKRTNSALRWKQFNMQKKKCFETKLFFENILEKNIFQRIFSSAARLKTEPSETKRGQSHNAKLFLTHALTFFCCVHSNSHFQSTTNSIFCL